jgi:hypothetical protein
MLTFFRRAAALRCGAVCCVLRVVQLAGCRIYGRPWGAAGRDLVVEGQREDVLRWQRLQ